MAVDRSGLRFVIITLDNHLASAADRARVTLSAEIPGLRLSFHAAADWNDPASLSRCLAAIADADIIVATMLFMEEHAQAVHAAILARRESCDAVVGCMSAPDIVKLTRVGRFNLDGSRRGAFDFLKKLRGGKKSSQAGGAEQMAMLRRIPRILRYIPGPAQDVRAYFLTLQYWLAGSEDNIASLVRFLRQSLRRGRQCDPSRPVRRSPADRLSRSRALSPSRGQPFRKRPRPLAASVRRIQRNGRHPSDALLPLGEQYRAL